jgi:hypothetical protein
VVLYFGDTAIPEYEKIFEMVAKRYDEAFFLRAMPSLEPHFNIT